MVFDVFLSYARSDGAEAANAIRWRLTSDGLRVWSDEALAVGEALPGAVEHAMAHSRVVVVLLSVGAARSEWVHRETTYALRRHTSVVPVVLDRGALDSPLGSLLGDRIFVDVSGKPSKDAAAEVVAALYTQGVLEPRRRNLRRPVLVFAAALLAFTLAASWVAWRATPGQAASRIRSGWATANQREVNLARAQLPGVNVETFDFSYAVLSAVDLSEAKMSSARFDYATMAEANLEGAKAEAASFVGTVLLAANLRGADLRGATLTSADLRLANVSGAVLSGAAMEGVRLEGAIFNKATLWPEHFDPEEQGAACIDCDRPA